MEAVVTTGAISRAKLYAVKSSPPTNQHPVFLQAGCPSCRPTNSVKALKGKISHSMDLIKYIGQRDYGSSYAGADLRQKASSATLPERPPLPSLLLPVLPSPRFSSLPSLFPPLPSLIEVGPSNPARGSRERCKLPQRGLGLSPSRNRIWCILALKSDIWWQQF